MHWINAPQEYAEYFGFVYRITNKNTKRIYIGSKQFFNIKRVQIKGKARKQIVRTESNWRTYISSSNSLASEIILIGHDKYIFEILSLHKTKQELKFTEAKLQWKAKAQNIDLYNFRIEPIYFNPQIKDFVLFV